MSDKITDLPVANSIDAVLDVFPIVTNSLNQTGQINRNTFLNIASQPVGLTDSQTLTNKTLTSPTLTTPTLGVASATTLNKVTLTAPATGSTLTIADGKTLTVSKTLTLTGTDSTTMTFPSSSDTVVGLAATQTLTNKTLTSPVIGTSILDTNGNTLSTITATASAVNYFTLANSATTGAIKLGAGGTDSNIGINISAKGSGFVSLNGVGIGVVGYVAAGETTASASYVQLTTKTDVATVTIGTNGLALVSFHCYAAVGTNGAIAYVSFAVSGATTIAAGTPASGTVEALNQQASGANGQNFNHAATILVTGLTAGSTTFSMEYKTSSGTGTFSQRTMSVVPL